MLTLSFFLAGLIHLCGTSASAGDLQPPDAPAPTMHTLGEIYEKIESLSTNIPAIPTQAIFSTSTGINATIIGAGGHILEGSCTIPKRENTITVIGLRHSLVLPRDAATGMPTGHQQHKPLTLTKYFDNATPLLYRALTTNENLPTITINFYRTDSLGKEIHYYTVELDNARVLSIDSIVSVNSYRNLEEVSFVYDTIRWTYEATGSQSEDTWGMSRE